MIVTETMSDSEGDTRTLLTCPRFTGEYLTWRKHFVLFASVKGFKEAVSKVADPNLPNSPLVTPSKRNVKSGH